MIALSIIRLLHYMEQTPDTYSYTACHIGCSSMLVEESSSPVRATNSRLENTKKPDYQSGFFVPVVRLYFRFFPSFERFFFHFCCIQCCWSRWPTTRCHYWHFHESRFFSKLQHTKVIKKRHFLLMYAVAVVRYVKSGKCWRGK
ncbi:Uncharacterised protein [Escherichia coli]|nr:Uncharacterised protein [Escherichia coli]